MAWRAPFDWIENGPAIFGLLTFSFIAGIIALGGPDHKTLVTLWRPDLKPGDAGSYLYLATLLRTSDGNGARIKSLSRLHALIWMILLIAFFVAIVSIPLEVLTGGG